MAKRKIEVPLSPKGIKDLSDYLDNYRKEIVERSQKLLMELWKFGERESEIRFDMAENGSTNTTHEYELSAIHFDGKDVTMDITVNGKDIFFIEYGAGVFYNGHLGESAHQSEKFRNAHPDFKIGKYGIDGDGENEYSLGAKDYWYYNGQMTHGTKATMPVYGAVSAMSSILAIKRAADRAFRD